MTMGFAALRSLLLGAVSLLCPAGTTPRRAPAGVLLEWCEEPGGAFHGPWLERDVAARVVREGEYSHGKPHGLWVTYFDDGAPQLEIGYREGRLDGVWRAWSPRRTPLREGHYRDGRPDGLWSVWLDDGSLLGSYVMNDGSGTMYTWYPDGRIRSKTRVERCTIVDGTTLFAEDGSRVTTLDDAGMQIGFECEHSP